MLDTRSLAPGLIRKLRVCEDLDYAMDFVGPREIVVWMLRPDQSIQNGRRRYQLLTIGFPPPHILFHHRSSTSPHHPPLNPNCDLSNQKFTNSQRDKSER